MSSNDMPDLDPATRAGLTSIISGLEGLIERDAAETIADALNDARIIANSGTATIPDTRLNHIWLARHRERPPRHGARLGRTGTSTRPAIAKADCL